MLNIYIAFTTFEIKKKDKDIEVSVDIQLIKEVRKAEVEALVEVQTLKGVKVSSVLVKVLEETNCAAQLEQAIRASKLFLSKVSRVKKFIRQLNMARGH